MRFFSDHLATERAGIGPDLAQASLMEYMVARGDLLRCVVNHFEADGALDLLTLDQNRLSVHCSRSGWYYTQKMSILDISESYVEQRALPSEVNWLARIATNCCDECLELSRVAEDRAVLPSVQSRGTVRRVGSIHLQCLLS